MLKFKGKYFVYLANTCTNSIAKRKCYSEVNILSTSLTNLAVTLENLDNYYNLWQFPARTDASLDLLIFVGKFHRKSFVTLTVVLSRNTIKTPRENKIARKLSAFKTGGP